MQAKSRMVWCLWLLSWPAWGQLRYHQGAEVPVYAAGNRLAMPWAGGLDMPQYNRLDLDGDGRDDLVVFDRHNHKIYTFLAGDTAYHHAPEYERYFPAGLKNWVLLRDYNCDGRPDLFTSSVFGMSLYENITGTNGLPAWELIYETIFTEGLSGQINLQVAAGDLPGISDVDGDGDLDILVFSFALGGGVHWHKNMSVERTGHCGLDLVKVTERYGDFAECTCETYIFGTATCPSGGRLQHSGGKTINLYDYRQAGVRDIVIGQENCRYAGYLADMGTPGVPLMTGVSFDFPVATAPLRLDFPAVFNFDADLDGDTDLLATNNYFDPAAGHYARNNWLYLNTGGSYHLERRDFLQHRMLEVGYAAAPALADPDGDGDSDLLLGSGGMPAGARLLLFANEGSLLSPRLVLADSNYLALAAAGYERLAPQFADINADGWPDLLVSCYGPGTLTLRLYRHSGNPLTPYPADQFLTLDLSGADAGDKLFFYVEEGRLWYLAGRESGRLSLYVNRGTLASPEWELYEDDYLGIADDYRARSLSVALADLDGDGRQDLLRYDNSGRLTVYTDYRGAARPVTDIWYDTLRQETYNLPQGNGVWLTTGFLTGNRQPDILIGYQTGGVGLLASLNDRQLPVEVPVRVQLFPNPVRQDRFVSLVANQAVEVYVADLRGQVVRQRVFLAAGQTTGMWLTGLRPGVYLLVATAVNGQRQVIRFVITG